MMMMIMLMMMVCRSLLDGDHDEPFNNLVLAQISSPQVFAPPDFWNSWFWLDPWMAGHVDAPIYSFRQP